LDWNLNALVVSEGFELIELPRPSDLLFKPAEREPFHSNWREIDWGIDAHETLNALQNLNADWIVVDHYGLWKEWENKVRTCGAKIMVIDDLGDREHQCDLLLDQNLGSDLSIYKDLVPENCKTFFGPSYALLRPEFNLYRLPSIARRRKNKIGHILVNFGGGNPDDYIAKILVAFSRVVLPKEVVITVVFGGLGEMSSEHSRLIAKLPVKVNFYGSVKNMAKLVASSDLVVGAAGSSSWERCCLGVPSIVFSVALNQEKIAQHLSVIGAAITLNKSDLMNGKFVAVVADLIQRSNLDLMVEKASSVCDGAGLEKIIGALHA